MIKAGKWTLSETEFENQFSEASKRGQAQSSNGLNAVAIEYDQPSNRMRIELRNGVILLVPCDKLQGLADARSEDIKVMKLVSHGAGIHWPKLDVQMTVSSLLAGVFGTKEWIKELEKTSRSNQKQSPATNQKQAS